MAIAVRKFKETIELGSPIIRRVRSHKYFPVIVITFLVLVAAIAHVWQRVAVIQLVKDVSILRAENKSLSDDSKKIQSQISRLAMTSRIEQLARDSLGLRRIMAERLFTLVSEEGKRIPSDELSTMFSSIKRVAEYLPTITPAEASAKELRTIDLDTLTSEPLE